MSFSSSTNSLDLTVRFSQLCIHAVGLRGIELVKTIILAQPHASR